MFLKNKLHGRGRQTFTSRTPYLAVVNIAIKGGDSGGLSRWSVRCSCCGRGWAVWCCCLCACRCITAAWRTWWACWIGRGRCWGAVWGHRGCWWRRYRCRLPKYFLESNAMMSVWQRHCKKNAVGPRQYTLFCRKRWYRTAVPCLRQTYGFECRMCNEH